MDNPGEYLDDLGVTCEALFLRFHRVGAHEAKDAMWNAVKEYSEQRARIDSQISDEFGTES